MRFTCYDALPLFNTVVEEMSFQNAAKRSHLSKGAVSYQIKKIESELGVELFERRRSGIVLTDAGQTLWNSVRLAYGELDRTLMALHNSVKDNVSQNIAIAMHTYFSSRWLSPRLTAFMHDNPEIALRIEPINKSEDLDHKETDLAIIWSHNGPPTNKAKLIYASQTFPTASTHIAKQIKEEGFDAVQERIPLLYDSSGDQSWRYWFQLTGRHYRQGQTKLEFPDTNSRVQAVIDGQGIALWDSLVAKEIEEGSLCFFSSQGLPNSGFYLIRCKETMSPAAKQFEGWLLNNANKGVSDY